MGPIAFQKLERCGIEEGGTVGGMDPTNVVRITAIGVASDRIDVQYLRNDGEVIPDGWGKIGNLGKIRNLGKIGQYLQLDFLKANEYIIAVRGSHDNDCIKSLQVETNLHTFGKVSSGYTPFELSALGGQIFGFHIRHTTDCLKAVGVYVKALEVNINSGVTDGGASMPPNAIEKLRRIGKEEGQVGDINPTSIIRIKKVGIQPCESGVEAFTVHYQRHDGEESINRWGAKTNSLKLKEIPLEENEYITAVKGHHSDVGVKSLELTTNLRTYGPFGTKGGTPFKIPDNDGAMAVKGLYDGAVKQLRETNLREVGARFKLPDNVGDILGFNAGGIIGFHACYTTQCLMAIGVYIKRSRQTVGLQEAVKKVMKDWYDPSTKLATDGKGLVSYRKLGPSGVADGEVKDFPDLAIVTSISKIDIYYEDCIHGLAVHYTCGGNAKTFNLGGNRGHTKTITLGENEYITAVRGHYDKIVRSIQLETNSGTFEICGVEKGTSFEYSALGGRIIGFHGRCSEQSLYAVGVHVKEEDTIRKLGPYGGYGGKVIDTKDPVGITRITKIEIRHGIYIDALSVTYNRFDMEGDACFRGGSEDASRSEVHLTEMALQANEYITAVRGHYNTRVVSVKFETNMCTYGPYGPEEGEPFEFSALGGQIIGFHGRSGSSLDAIGVYIKVFGACQTVTKEG